MAGKTTLLPSDGKASPEDRQAVKTRSDGFKRNALGVVDNVQCSGISLESDFGNGGIVQFKADVPLRNPWWRRRRASRAKGQEEQQVPHSKSKRMPCANGSALP